MTERIDVGRCDDGSVTAVPDMTMLSALWTDVRGTDEAAVLEAELARVVTDGHILRRVPAAAVAVRKLRKEAVFRLTDGRWAWVHLTWRADVGPRWPSTCVTDSWAALVDELRDGGRA